MKLLTDIEFQERANRITARWVWIGFIVMISGAMVGGLPGLLIGAILGCLMGFFLCWIPGWAWAIVLGAGLLWLLESTPL